MFITLIPAIVLVPAVIPFVVALSVLCVLMYRAYGDVNIEIARLYMMSIGPILSSFSSYVQGLDTIRAFDRVPVFNTAFDGAIKGFMDVSERARVGLEGLVKGNSTHLTNGPEVETSPSPSPSPAPSPAPAPAPSPSPSPSHALYLVTGR